MQKRNQLEQKELKALGTRLRVLRAERDLTQEDIAKRINAFRYQVSHWENGISLIPSVYLFRISKALGISLRYFDIYSN